MKSLTLLIAGIILVFATLPAQAKSGFIPDANRVDIAYDTIRQILYISGGDSVRRYDMANKKFASPISLGGQTMGMDISPDGKFLAVANSSRGATQNFIDIINLRTLTAQRVSFDLDFMEGGTYTAAFDGLGNILVSSTFEGSGWVPLRKYNYLSKQTSVLGSVRQSSMLTASTDRTMIAVAESNSSDGPWGVYRAGDEQYSSKYSTGWFNFEIGISYNGGQVAVPTYGGTFIKDNKKTFPAVGTYAGVTPIGVAYASVGSMVYFAMADSDYIAVYNINTMTEANRYKVPGHFDWTGNGAFAEGRTKIAADNSFLFSTLDNGIIYLPLRVPAR
jgi:DNA-binding beta-propeller fold protein YncE